MASTVKKKKKTVSKKKSPTSKKNKQNSSTKTNVPQPKLNSYPLSSKPSKQEKYKQPFHAVEIIEKTDGGKVDRVHGGRVSTR